MADRPLTPDYCTREGAELLARKLDEWWHKQGYTQVIHTVTVLPGTRKRTSKYSDRDPPIWIVRSNLVGGLPP